MLRALTMIQLSYRSTSAVDDGSSTFFTTIARILEQALINNARQQITGALAYHTGSFIQILEGPAASVDQMFARIKADPRHRDCQLIARRTIERRSFESWSMAYVARGDLGGVLALLGGRSPATYDAAIERLAEGIV